MYMIKKNRKKNEKYENKSKQKRNVLENKAIVNSLRKHDIYEK